MARLSISMRNDLVNTLEEQAASKGKTVSSIISEAANLYIETDNAGLRLEDIQKSVKILEIMRHIDAVPIPSILLDNIVRISWDTSEKEITQGWYDRGLVLGNILRSYARDFRELAGFIREFRFLIPIDMLEIDFSENNVQIVLYGVGKSLQAAVCTAEGIRGLLHAYGYVVRESETSESFVKISAGEQK